MNPYTNALVVFQGKQIRRTWHNNEWYFSVIDIVAVLTEQEDFQTARKYWNKLSQRLREEWSEVVTNCHRLKLLAEDNWKEFKGLKKENLRDHMNDLDLIFTMLGERVTTEITRNYDYIIQ